MPRKGIIEYEFMPKNLESGERWINLRIKNIGTDELANLSIKIHTLDSFAIDILDSGDFIPMIMPDEELVLHFKVYVNLAGSLYFSMDGYRGNQKYFFESAPVYLTVEETRAELLSLFSMERPRFARGSTISCEATVKALKDVESLRVELYAEAPDGSLDEIDVLETEPFKEDEIRVFKVEMEPESTGLYTVHTYLYDGISRLGYKRDYAYVEG